MLCPVAVTIRIPIPIPISISIAIRIRIRLGTHISPSPSTSPLRIRHLLTPIKLLIATPHRRRHEVREIAPVDLKRPVGYARVHDGGGAHAAQRAAERLQIFELAVEEGVPRDERHGEVVGKEGGGGGGGGGEGEEEEGEERGGEHGWFRGGRGRGCGWYSYRACGCGRRQDVRW